MELESGIWKTSSCRPLWETKLTWKRTRTFLHRTKHGPPRGLAGGHGQLKLVGPQQGADDALHLLEKKTSSHGCMRVFLRILSGKPKKTQTPGFGTYPQGFPCQGPFSAAHSVVLILQPMRERSEGDS